MSTLIFKGVFSPSFPQVRFSCRFSTVVPKKGHSAQHVAAFLTSCSTFPTATHNLPCKISHAVISDGARNAFSRNYKRPLVSRSKNEVTKIEPYILYELSQESKVFLLYHWMLSPFAHAFEAAGNLLLPSDHSSLNLPAHFSSATFPCRSLSTACPHHIQCYRNLCVLKCHYVTRTVA